MRFPVLLESYKVNLWTNNLWTLIQLYNIIHHLPEENEQTLSLVCVSQERKSLGQKGTSEAVLSSCTLKVRLLLTLDQSSFASSTYSGSSAASHLPWEGVFLMLSLNPPSHSFWPLLTAPSSCSNKSSSLCFNLLFTKTNKPSSPESPWRSHVS